MKNFLPILRERETRWVLILLGLATAFRLWYCTYNDLVGDEAYYWLWSKHLDASYYSKGPAVAWTIALGTHLFGDSVFGVRWWSVMLSLGTGWQFYLLARRLYSPLTGFWVVLVAALTPLFAVGSVLMTIDPLSVFFWVWSANLFLDALETASVFRWALVGFGVGCGFLAKYTNGLELLSFLIFLLCSPSHRPKIWRLNSLVTFLAFLLLASPVFFWNQQHHWITAEHLKEGGHLDQKLHLSLSEFSKFVVGQGLVLSPLLFLAIVFAVIAKLRSPLNWQAIYLQSLFWPIFGGYALLSFHDAANPNWPALAYFGGLILAVEFWSSCLRPPSLRPTALQKIQTRVAYSFCGLALFIALVMTALFHETRPLRGILHKDPLLRARGWREFGERAELFRQKFQPDFLLANDYATASELSFYLPGQPQTYIPSTGRLQNQFSFWPTYSHEPGQKILYITDDPIETLPGLLRQEFSHVVSVGQFERTDHGYHIETYRVWLLSN